MAVCLLSAVSASADQGDFSSSGGGTYAGRVVIDTMTLEMSGTDTDSEGTTCDVEVDFAGER